MPMPHVAEHGKAVELHSRVLHVVYRSSGLRVVGAKILRSTDHECGADTSCAVACKKL